METSEDIIEESEELGFDVGELIQLVVFLLEGHRYALPIVTVVRIIHAVHVTPLPDAPTIVSGAINLQGEVVAVLNVRRRFQLPERDLRVSDLFVIARTDRRTVALVVDEVHGVIEHERSSVIASDSIAPGLDQFHGVVKLDDGLVLIQDLEKFLSLDQARTLDEALDRVERC